jgi:hypothetical protein
MFVLVQLPFADARPFVAGARRLRIPPWPLPKPNSEFVRAVGQVRERRRGGVHPWLGEDVYCDARRALRIEPAASVGRRGLCRSRRYLSDGCAVSRVEIGIVLAPSVCTVAAALERALSLPFSVPDPAGRIDGCPLELHFPLARHLLHSTTWFEVADSFWGESWWLEPVAPLVIAECRDESLAPPEGSRPVPVARDFGISLHTFKVSAFETTVRVWLLCPHADADRDVVRRLRVHLLLLHAERMALRHILRMLAMGRLDTERGSEEFDRLQRYLGGTFQGLGREHRYGFRQETILDAAYHADGLVSDDMRNTIFAQLAEARLNIRRIVDRQLVREAVAGRQSPDSVLDQTVVFGDLYQVTGQAGAVGANAQVGQVKVARIWHELSAEIELADLGVELELLHRKMSMQGLTATQRDEALEVFRAAGAAKRGDGPGTLEHLARTGRWVLHAARDIGVDLAAAVIRELLSV